MKDKYDELRAAIAAVRKVNKGLLRSRPPRAAGEMRRGRRRGG